MPKYPQPDQINLNSKETGLHLSFVDQQRSLLILLLLSSSAIIGNMFLFIKNMEYIFDPDDKFISEMIK